MTVQRRNRHKPSKPAQPAEKAAPPKQGFTILQDEVPEPEEEMQVMNKRNAEEASSQNKNFDDITNSLRMADSCISKPQKSNEMVAIRGHAPKGLTPDPSPFLIGKKKKVVKRDAKASEKKVAKTIIPDDMRKREASTRGDLEHTLWEEATLWRQKSCRDWIRDGDRNTHFFHMSTPKRRSFNKISSFRHPDGS
ncbi:hypothetical protein LINPERHAP2_LOCUS14645 [Linum perenne]